MKALGANVVRIHLQTAKFMNAPQEPNQVAPKQLARLLDLPGAITRDWLKYFKAKTPDILHLRSQPNRL